MLPISYRIMSESLTEGETMRTECPSCGRKDTFTMTRKDGALLWNCYSAHCCEKGVMGGTRRNVVRTTSRPEPRKQRVSPFTGELRELNDEERANLRDRIGFRQEEHFNKSGVLYAPIEGRYAYPIYAPTGARRGWVLRAYDDIALRRKSLTRLDREEPHMSWYQGAEHSHKLLIVEDIPSAVRASMHFPGWVVAMCGGGIGPDYVRELAAYGRRIVWAFDGDATAAAVKHHRTYGLCFESSSVLQLSKDLKDLDEETLKEVLSHVAI